MDAKLEKYKQFLLKTAFWAVLVALVYCGCKYFLPLIGPFVLGYIFACIIKPLVDVLQKRLHIKRTFAAIFAVLLFFGVIGLLLALGSVNLLIEARDLILRIPTIYNEQIAPSIAGMFDWAEKLLQRIDPSIELSIDETAQYLSDALGSLVSRFSSTAIAGTARFASHIPALLVQVIFCILSTFYIANDYSLIADFVYRQLPERAATVLRRGRQQLGETLGRYIRSYGIILGITFVELCIGFCILRIEGAGGLALLIAMFDILPVVGTSAVLVPWTVILFLQGKIPMAIGMAVIAAVVWVVRNIMEPKIVGDQVGLHPLVTLMAMYVGTKLFGGFGLLGLPVSLAILQALQKEGTISVYK